MRVSVQCCTALCVLSLLIGGILGQLALAGEAEAAQEAVKTAIVSHYEKIHSLTFSVDLLATSDNPKSISVSGQFDVKVEFRAGKPGHVSRFYRDVAKDEPEFVIDESGEIVARECNERWADAYDGETAQQLRAYMDGAAYRKGQVQGYLRANPPNISDSWAWALLPAGPGWMANMLGDALISGPIEWQGKQVYAVDVYYGIPNSSDYQRNVTFYVDPQKDYAFCYAEFRLQDGEVSRKTIIGAFQEVNGIWLPAKFEGLTYFATEVTKSAGSIEYSGVNEEMDVSDFRFEWPNGTLVHDELAGVEYYVGSSVPDDMTLLADEARLDGLLEELDATQEEGEGRGEPPAAARANSGTGEHRAAVAPTASQGLWIWTTAIVSFLVAAIAVGIYRLRAGKGTRGK